jgi:hypothetical protein
MGLAGKGKGVWEWPRFVCLSKPNAKARWREDIAKKSLNM